MRRGVLVLLALAAIAAGACQDPSSTEQTGHGGPSSGVARVAAGSPS